MATREPPRRWGPLRHERRRGQAQPLEHTPRIASVGLVFSVRLTQVPLEEDWQLPELARPVALPVLRWPNPPVPADR